MRLAIVVAVAALLLAAHSCLGQTLPPNAVLYLPLLKAEQRVYWPDMSLPSALGSQVEQETCISLKHRTCWSPRAELKTSREYGFGFGQITKTASFDVFKEVKVLDKSLAAWQWDDRYDPQLQLRALVLKDKQAYGQVTWSTDPYERLAFSMAAYNGGMGGVMSDRRVCLATRGCVPSRWFGLVERTSLKQKVPLSGYGQSFYQINRGYVVNVLVTRRAKYIVPLEVTP